MQMKSLLLGRTPSFTPNARKGLPTNFHVRCAAAPGRSTGNGDLGFSRVLQPDVEGCQLGQRRRQERSKVVTTATADSEREYSPADNSRHAVLHDFCMGIPFGAVTLAAGVVSLFFGAQQTGGLIALAGAAVCLTSVLSLKAWKAEVSSTRYTFTSSGVTLGLCALLYRTYKSATSQLPALVMLALSSAMLLFLLYNMAAGGNPPKKSA